MVAFALATEAYAFGAVYTVTGRSLVVFLLGRNGPTGSAQERRARRKGGAEPAGG